MRNIFLLIIVVAFACGCSQKPDPRIAVLETKVADLQKTLSQQDDFINAVYACETNDAFQIANLAVVMAQSVQSPPPASALTAAGSASQDIDPATGLPTSGPIKVVRVANRVTEANGAWWRWAFTVFIADPDGLTPTVNVKVKFLDKDGFIIETKDMYNLKLDGAATNSFSDYELVSLPGAQQVTSIRGEIVE